MDSDLVGYKWIQDNNGTWHLKDQDYVTVRTANFVEAKLDMLKEVVNYLLEKNFNS